MRSWLRFWNNCTIAGKLKLSFSVLSALFALIVGTWFGSLQLVKRGESAIELCREIENIVCDMDRKMEKAKRLHRDFFLYYEKIGLAEAHVQYVQPSIRMAAEAAAESIELQEKIKAAKVSEELGRRKVDVNLFLSSAKRFADTSIESIEQVTKLAAPEYGLEARFESVAAELAAKAAGSPALKDQLQEIMTYYLRYKVSRKRYVMQSAFNVIFVLRRDLQIPGIYELAEPQQVDEMLISLKGLGDSILDTDHAIQQLFNDFSLQAQTITNIAKTLEDLSQEEVAKAERQVVWTHRTAMLLIAALTFLAIVFGSIVALAMHRSIAGRIAALTASAARLRRGHLDFSVAEDVADEVGQLGKTFNMMAGRIKELVGELESRVEERTRQLAESERRFRNLFDHTSSGVVVLSAVDDGADFIIRDCNSSFARIEKIDREEAIGRRVGELFSCSLSELGMALVRQVWQTGNHAHFGPVGPIGRNRSGWRQGHIYAIPTGEVVMVYDDVTREHEAELERAAMEARLQRAEKMEALGLLAGGVAHDLNNILSGIIGYPELLLLQLEEGSSLRRPVEAIRESGQRAAAVVADLLTVARGIASERKICRMNDLVREYLHSPEFKKLAADHPGIIWTKRLNENSGQLACSPIHIKKCLMNLVINAAEAITGAGNIIITTSRSEVSEERAAALGIQPGDYVVLDVADSGRGISREDLDHIFEPFYTKKVMDRSGTGLGLTVVWNTVQDHSGGIVVDSSPRGTTFTLYFPAAAGRIEGDGQKEKAENPRGAGEKVLVVDDEELQQDVAGRMLEELGYEVLKATSGEQAVELLQHTKVDLLVLDMLMEPGMNGRETYERIIALRPGQKALIVSGFSENSEVRRARSLGAGGFLQKPYSLRELADTVRGILDR